MLFSVCGCDTRGEHGCETRENMVVVPQGGAWLWHKRETSLWCARGGTCMVVRQGGTQGKKIANPINENENHTIWLLKEVHHEKPNQSLSEIIVIQVVLCTI